MTANEWDNETTLEKYVRYGLAPENSTPRVLAATSARPAKRAGFVSGPAPSRGTVVGAGPMPHLEEINEMKLWEGIRSRET